jgi:hypothetical protein
LHVINLEALTEVGGKIEVRDNATMRIRAKWRKIGP